MEFVVCLNKISPCRPGHLSDSKIDIRSLKILIKVVIFTHFDILSSDLVPDVRLRFFSFSPQFSYHFHVGLGLGAGGG